MIYFLNSIENYRCFAILNGYVTCPNETIDSNRYLFDNLIKPGEWQNCGANSVKAEVNLMFNYDDKRLNLNINEAALKLPESETVPIVLFSGNFNYNLTSNSPGDRLSKLKNIINNWQQDLELYQEVVAKFANVQIAERSQKTQEPVSV